MSGAQLSILILLAATVALFLWGRWRHDVVALASLIVCAVTELVPGTEAFSGFGHPAVITVICVLVLSGGLQATGAIDAVARTLLPRSAGIVPASMSLVVLAVVFSAFMNNVGALALLMPIAIQTADRFHLPPGRLLMPLAFGSILGGMTTLIGTPPNLIVAGFRVELTGRTFEMFDYSPVGVLVALAGLVFIGVAARFLVPARERTGVKGFETGAYFTEARVPEGSPAVGMTIGNAEASLAEADALIIGIVRGDRRIPAPSRFREIHTDDIVLIEAEPKALASVLSVLGLRFEEGVRQQIAAQKEAASAKRADGTEEPRVPETGAEADGVEGLKSEEITLTELAVLPNADIVGRSATGIGLRSRYGINLLAVSRQGRRSTARLRTLPIKVGDVLLMQGTPEAIADFAARFGCVPLAERALRVPEPGKAYAATAIMVAAIGLAASGLLAPTIAFAGGVLLFLVFGIVSPRVVYQSVDWPVVVLLGALIPVAGAMASTGAADLIANILLEQLAQGRPIIALAVVLVVSMTLSDFMNNAATAAVMCPIAIGTAEQLGASADPFLMAVAVGSSCAFLTPVGHQNNTLILGPGGFRFGDYWKLGLPLEVIVLSVAVPLILTVWPL